MSASKGQKFNRYSEDTKMEVVRLFLEEGLTYSQIQKQLGIKSHTQIMNWVQKFNAGESFEDYRGRLNKKHFNNVEEEVAYLKAQVEYLKKLNPNLQPIPEMRLLVTFRSTTMNASRKNSATARRWNIERQSSLKNLFL